MSLLTTMSTSEKATQKSMTSPTLRAPGQLLVGVVPRARPLLHPVPRRPERGRSAPLGGLGFEPAILQTLAGGIGVVAAIQMHARPIGQSSHRLRGVFQG